MPEVAEDSGRAAGTPAAEEGRTVEVVVRAQEFHERVYMILVGHVNGIGVAVRQTEILTGWA